MWRELSRNQPRVFKVTCAQDKVKTPFHDVHHPIVQTDVEFDHGIVRDELIERGDDDTASHGRGMHTFNRAQR
ncbi:hypothetical protein [Mesorhizobium sp. CAU 1732]|uniref:hypothetical protein n=1 Tax=Mesorhizobium sp. CAU 1732 TaxID=3140358 RepID=UPI0032612F39